MVEIKHQMNVCICNRKSFSGCVDVFSPGLSLSMDEGLDSDDMSERDSSDEGKLRRKRCHNCILNILMRQVKD